MITGNPVFKEAPLRKKSEGYHESLSAENYVVPFDPPEVPRRAFHEVDIGAFRA